MPFATGRPVDQLVLPDGERGDETEPVLRVVCRSILHILHYLCLRLDAVHLQRRGLGVSGQAFSDPDQLVVPDPFE